MFGNNRKPHGIRQFLTITAISIAIGLALGFFRYDDGCLETGHRILVAGLNAFIVIGGAAVITPYGTRFGSDSKPRLIAVSLISGFLIAALATALSIAIVRPLVAPESLRLADYLYVFFVPGFLVFLTVAHVAQLQTRNRDFVRQIDAYRADSKPRAIAGKPHGPVMAPSIGAAARSTGAADYMIPGKSAACISTAAIIYVSSRRKKTVLHTEGRDFEINRLLKDVLRELPGDFQRVHKSFLVNLAYVDGVRYRFGGNYEITLRDEDDTTLPVGRRYLNDLRRVLRAS